MALLQIPSSIIYPAAYAFTTYVLLIFGYRLLLHPLRNIPGPFIARFTDWHTFYHSLKTDLHLATRDDHLKYGPVIRHGPNKLIFNSATAFHEIYDNSRVDKARTYNATRSTPHPNIFNVIDKQRHRVKRKLIGRVLSDVSMRKFEPVMLEQVDIFTRTLSDAADASTPVNVTSNCEYLGMDVVAHLAFGYALNLQTQPANREMLSWAKGSAYRMNVYMQYPLLSKLYLEFLPRMAQLFIKHSFVHTLLIMIKARLALDKDAKHDLYAHVADAMDAEEGERIALKEIWSEALFFFPAGGGTTVTALSGLFFYLSRHPQVYKRLAEEIRSTFRSVDEIKGGPRLSGCHYLRACIDETLRVSPPVGGTLWREKSLNDGGREPLVIDGQQIPEGTIVGVNIYSLQHNEKYFPDPYTFKPERWLSEGSTEEQRRTMNYAFAAFMIGARACAGKNMAYLEMSVVIARTLFQFDFEKAPGKLGEYGTRTVPAGVTGGAPKQEFLMKDAFSAFHDGPYLTFRHWQAP